MVPIKTSKALSLLDYNHALILKSIDRGKKKIPKEAGVYRIR
jgi:hypothetical protein